MKSLNKSNNKGFTVIELLVAVAIIGVLSAIAINAYQSYLKKSKDVAQWDAFNQLWINVIAHSGDCASATALTTAPEGYLALYTNANNLITGSAGTLATTAFPATGLFTPNTTCGNAATALASLTSYQDGQILTIAWDPATRTRTCQPASANDKLGAIVGNNTTTAKPC